MDKPSGPPRTTWWTACAAPGRAPRGAHRNARSLRHRRAARLRRPGDAPGALLHGRREELPGDRPPGLRHRHRRSTGAAAARRAPVEVVDDAGLRAACARLVGTLPQSRPPSPPSGWRRAAIRPRPRRTSGRAGAGGSPSTPGAARARGDAVEMDVRCAPGTYVRALARDLGSGPGRGRAPDGAAADAQRGLRRGSAIPFDASATRPPDPVGRAASGLARGALVRAAPGRSASDATSQGTGGGAWPDSAAHVCVDSKTDA